MWIKLISYKLNRKRKLTRGYYSGSVSCVPLFSIKNDYIYNKCYTYDFLTKTITFSINSVFWFGKFSEHTNGKTYYLCG